MPQRRRTCEAGTEGNESPELKLCWKHLCKLNVVCSFLAYKRVSSVKYFPFWKLRGLGDKRNSFFKKHCHNLCFRGTQKWKDLPRDVIANKVLVVTQCAQSLNRLGHQISFHSLHWSELRCICLLQHSPAWVRAQQLPFSDVVLPCPKKPDQDFWSRCSDLQNRISAQICLLLQLSLPVPIYFPCSSPLNLLVSRSFHLQPGKFFSWRNPAA